MSPEFKQALTDWAEAGRLYRLNRGALFQELSWLWFRKKARP